MSDKKKTTNKKKFRINDNVLRILNIIFAVIAVISLVATILLSPIGDKLLKRENSPDAPTTTEALMGGSSDNTAETEIRFGLYYSPKLDGYYWPEPTEPTVDTATPYSIVVNSYRFNYANEAGITTVTAKEDPTAVMVITPLSGVSYDSLTETVSADLGKPTDNVLERVQISCAYSSEENGYKTVVYCVDDLKGGSIEIRYTFPTDYENSYETQFELMLDMFDLIY